MVIEIDCASTLSVVYSSAIRLFRLCLDEIEVGAFYNLLIVTACQTEPHAGFPFLEDNPFQSPEQDLNKAIERLLRTTPMVSKGCRASPHRGLMFFGRQPKKQFGRIAVRKAPLCAVVPAIIFRFKVEHLLKLDRFLDFQAGHKGSSSPSEVGVRSGATHHSAGRSPLPTGPCIRTASTDHSQ